MVASQEIRRSSLLTHNLKCGRFVSAEQTFISHFKPHSAPAHEYSCRAGRSPRRHSHRLYPSFDVVPESREVFTANTRYRSGRVPREAPGIDSDRHRREIKLL